MRPLPIWDELPQQPSVYTDAQDSFVSAFADLFTQQSSLLDQLASQENDQTSSAGAIAGTVDAMDSSLNTTIEIFDALAAADRTVDLTDAIAEAASLDRNLISNLDNWAPDIGTLAVSFTNQLLLLFNYMQNYLEQIISDAISNLESWIESILSWLGQM